MKIVTILQDWKHFLKENLPNLCQVKWNDDGSLFNFIWHIKDGFIIGEPNNFPKIMVTKHTRSMYFTLWFDINNINDIHRAEGVYND